MPLDVLIVGAGLSGIGAARHLQAQCPNLSWAIVEARQSLGGTWDLFRYPGVRSDSDMHTLGYSFKPWAQRKAIADGASILCYIQETANEGGILPKIRFGLKVKQAHWSSAQACWQIELQKQPSGESVTIRASFLYLCSGYYSYAQAYQPAFEGQEDFKGRWIHPQFWPKDLDYAGKNIVVIGSGATAVTLVPEMAKTAAHVTMLQRSPSYVIARPSEDMLANGLAKLLPSRWAYALTRWKNVLLGMYFYSLSQRSPAMVKRYLMMLAAKALGPSFDTAKHFSPSYRPWDQRVCAVPDGDLFTQIRNGKASVVTDTIERITPQGILLKSGQELAADVIVCATGLQLNVLGDIDFSVDGKAFVPGQSIAYKGMMLSGLPNAALAFGYTNASWTLRADLIAGYVCRLLIHMQKHGYKKAWAEHDASLKTSPFMGLTSGYVARSQAALPKQGDRKPWQVHQNYLADLITIRYGRIDDGVLQFR